MDYFDALKGLTETRSSNHELTFGDLLRECRESAKEEVGEKQIKEYFDPIGLVESFDASYSREAFEADGGYEVEELWDTIGGLVAEAREVLVAAEAYAKEHSIGRCTELPGEFPTFWMETSDAFDMAAERDYSGLTEVLQAVIDYGRPGEHEAEESKVDEGRLNISFTSEKEHDFVKSVGKKYHSQLVGWTMFPDDAVFDGQPEILSKVRQTIDKAASKYPGISIDESKVNEQEPEDELDTERPEKPRSKPREEEPDPNAPPEPPDEVKEPEQPMEMRKEYLGKSEETHYYFITTEGGEGIIDDFVITDQEGVQKYSAKNQDIEVTEENVADFLIQAIRDVQIAQIERSIFMKYIYPKLEEESKEEEEIIGEPEEDEEKPKKEKPLAPEEEEKPLESRKITEQTKGLTRNVMDLLSDRGYEVDFKKVYDYLENLSDEEYDSIQDDVSQGQEESAMEMLSGLDLRKKSQWPEEVKMKWPEDEDETDEKCNKKVKESEFKLNETDVVALYREYRENLEPYEAIYKVATELDFDPQDVLDQLRLKNAIHPNIKTMRAVKSKLMPESENLKESHLIEMKVTDDEGNEFNVYLTDNDTDETVIDINGREFRRSPEFVSVYRDEDGTISEEGLRELALDHLANLEKDEYSEMVAIGAEQEVSDDKEKDVEDIREPALEIEKEPVEDEEEVLGGEEPTDDVDVSKPGPIKPHLKYRPKQKAEAPAGTGLGAEGDYSNPFENKEITENFEAIEQELDVLDKMSIGELRDVVGEEANRLPEKDDLIDAAMHKKFGDKYTKYLKRQVGLENKNIKGDNEMVEKKTPEALHQEATRLEAEAKKLHTEAEDLKLKKEKEAKAKKEGINPKDGDSEEKKIKKLSETDVVKGTKALKQLASAAAKESDYAKAAEHYTKLAEIEAMVPEEAEAEAKKDTKPDKEEAPEKKDDVKADEDTPSKEEVDELTDEKVDPAAVEEAKRSKDDKEAKAKKDKKEKEAKAKKDKADKEAKAKKDKEAKAKKAKKENKIQVDSIEDISERKSTERLEDLLRMYN